jgi:hypothetical protein
MTKQSSAVSELKDTILHDKTLHAVVLACVAIVSAIVIISGIISLATGAMFVSGSTTGFTEKDTTVFLLSIATLLVTLVLLRKHLKLAVHKLFVFLYYAFGALYGVSLAVFICAVIADLSDGLASFLTAPVGIKPDHEYTGWANPWWLFPAVAAFMWILFKMFKHLKETTAPAAPIGPGVTVVRPD